MEESLTQGKKKVIVPQSRKRPSLPTVMCQKVELHHPYVQDPSDRKAKYLELYPLIGYTLYMYLYGFMIPFYSPQRLVSLYERRDD